MTNFTTPTEIANRGLQKLGSKRIAAGLLLTEDSKSAAESRACYDKLRRAELRRNVWRFSIRRTILRPIDTALPEWDSTVTYASGAYVEYNDVNYISLQGTNLNQNPETETAYWSVYTGRTSFKITPSIWSSVTTYGIGALATGTDTLVYVSVAASNLNHDPATDTAATYWQLYFGSLHATAYDSETTYSIGELVFSVANTIYASTIMDNDNDPSTGTGWVTIACTSTPIVVPWPAGTGPQATSRGIYVIPNGFLRQAPSDPRAGDYSDLGYPSNMLGTDWMFEGGYIVTREPGPIMLRFAADITQVPFMDDMFCEGLACRMAFEMCEAMTNSSAKLRDIGAEYKTFMGEARIVNAIEVASVQPPLDDYIAVRA